MASAKLAAIEKEAAADGRLELDPFGYAEAAIRTRAKAVASAIAASPDAVLSPYVELCLHAGDDRAKSLLALEKPAARVLSLAKKLDATRPKLATGLLYMCARNVAQPKTRALAAELLGATLKRGDVPIGARMWADAFYDKAKMPAERAAILADPEYVLAHSDPVSVAKKLARLAVPDVNARLTKLADAISKLPEKEAIAKKIRALIPR